MKRIILMLMLMACGKDDGKDTVVIQDPPPVNKEPLTKCDEQTDLAESKVVQCGFGETGIRVMVCGTLGWYTAYSDCKLEKKSLESSETSEEIVPKPNSSSQSS